jgi:hypothetical protein
MIKSRQGRSCRPGAPETRLSSSTIQYPDRVPGARCSARPRSDVAPDPAEAGDQARFWRNEVWRDAGCLPLPAGFPRQPALAPVAPVSPKRVWTVIGAPHH